RDSGSGSWILAFRGHLLIGSLETGQVRRGCGQTTGGKSQTGEKAAPVGTRRGRNRLVRNREAGGHDRASSNRNGSDHPSITIAERQRYYDRRRDIVSQMTDEWVISCGFRPYAQGKSHRSGYLFPATRIRRRRRRCVAHGNFPENF